jgi:single-stranded DNA-binding protein
VEEYTDRDGNKRHSLEVNATDMQFIGAGGRSEDAGAPAARGAAAQANSGPVNEPTDLTDDDVPF